MVGRPHARQYAQSLTTFENWYHLLLERRLRDSLVVQWLGPCPSTAEGSGSIPGWGTKILQAEGKKKKKKKTKKQRKREG